MSKSQDDNWSAKVLDFWFRELQPKDWFAKDDVMDAEIERRFAPLHRQLSKEPTESLLTSPDQGLAAILVLDQFSRNLFRGEPASFASDPQCLALARAMVAKAWDQNIPQDRRVFVYLPFEHSEDLTDQNTAVSLIETLGDEQFTRYANAHREVIARFGRFPHRNAILGRVSTPQEVAYLSQPGSGF